MDWLWRMAFYLRIFHCAGTRPFTRYPLWSIQLSLNEER
jgi:hypothetical protein